MTDHDDLEALFSSHYPRLVRALSAVDGSSDLATDAVQAAFVQAYLKWRRISRYDDPAAWVRRVAVNRLRNEQRGRRRQLAVVDRLAAAPPLPAPGGDDLDPDLVDALRRLPRQQRLAVALHYVADLSVADVAAAMAVSEGTVKTHLHRARAELAVTLAVLRDR